MRFPSYFLCFNSIFYFIVHRIVSCLRLTSGGMWQLPQSRGGACFCTRGAKQGYDVDLFIVALAKTVTPAGAPGGSRGGLCRTTTQRSSLPESSRGTEGNAIYRPVRDSSGLFVLSWRRKDFTRIQLNRLLNLLTKPLHIR
jgi:hypothetical protein